jgi:hypothetical protein
MLLAAVYTIVLEMRRSLVAWPTGRTRAQLLALGLSRADVLYPQFATAIRAGTAGAKDLIEAAAEAMLSTDDFATSSDRIGGPTLPAALAGFMDSALTATLA